MEKFSFDMICDNVKLQSESGCGSNCSLKEVSSQDLRLDVEDTNELKSVQGLLDRLFDSNGWRIPDSCCENFNKVGFSTHLVQFQE